MRSSGRGIIIPVWQETSGAVWRGLCKIYSVSGDERLFLPSPMIITDDKRYHS